MSESPVRDREQAIERVLAVMTEPPTSSSSSLTYDLAARIVDALLPQPDHSHVWRPAESCSCGATLYVQALSLSGQALERAAFRAAHADCLDAREVAANFRRLTEAVERSMEQGRRAAGRRGVDVTGSEGRI